jgi:hypothetical protein
MVPGGGREHLAALDANPVNLTTTDACGSRKSA